jgi:hypothetical protein
MEESDIYFTEMGIDEFYYTIIVKTIFEIVKHTLQKWLTQN